MGLNDSIIYLMIYKFLFSKSKKFFISAIYVDKPILCINYTYCLRGIFEKLAEINPLQFQFLLRNFFVPNIFIYYTDSNLICIKYYWETNYICIYKYSIFSFSFAFCINDTTTHNYVGKFISILCFRICNNIINIQSFYYINIILKNSLKRFICFDDSIRIIKYDNAIFRVFEYFFRIYILQFQFFYKSK